MSVEDDWKNKSLCPRRNRREPHGQHRLENERGDGFTCTGWSADQRTIITTRIEAGEGEKFTPGAINHLIDTDLGYGMLRRAEISADRSTATLVIEVTSPSLLAKIQDGYGVYTQFQDGSIYAGITQEQPLRHRDGDQPLPVPNDHPTTYDLVVEDLMARKELGIRRYGVALQPGNGRDNLRDHYEEILDACVYVRTEMEERKLRDAVGRERAWEQKHELLEALGMDPLSDWDDAINVVRGLTKDLHETPHTIKTKAKIEAVPNETFAPDVFDAIIGLEANGCVLTSAEVAPDGRSVEVSIEIKTSMIIADIRKAFEESLHEMPLPPLRMTPHDG